MRDAARALRHDERGFTGAEKALLICFALAVIVLVVGLVQRGGERAARDAERTLRDQGGQVTALGKVADAPRAGDVGGPGTAAAPGPLRYSGDFRAEAPAPVSQERKGGFLDAVGGFFGQVGGFFKGLALGAADTVVGIAGLVKTAWHFSPIGMIVDPKGTRAEAEKWANIGRTLWNNPGAVWDAIKEPYVTAWKEGRYGEAIGRGAFEIASIVLGSKGLDKIGKGGKVADTVSDVGKVADKASDVGKAADKASDVGKAADKASDVGKGLPKPDSELEKAAKTRADALEKADNGHSIARHGPEVSDAELELRLRTGKAPDGVFSPTPASTRFKSFDDWVKTRDAALREIERREGIDLSKPPGPGDPTRYTATVDHGRPVGDGFVGRKGTETKITDPATGKKGKVYGDVDPVDGLTRTKTSIEWNPATGRWEVKQHFPSAEGWDPATGRYTQAVP